LISAQQWFSAINTDKKKETLNIAARAQYPGVMQTCWKSLLRQPYATKTPKKYVLGSQIHKPNMYMGQTPASGQGTAGLSSTMLVFPGVFSDSQSVTASYRASIKVALVIIRSS